MEATAVERFEASRPRLASLAYRLLGSAADAEDAVQDTYLLHVQLVVDRSKLTRKLSSWHLWAAAQLSCPALLQGFGALLQ